MIAGASPVPDPMPASRHIVTPLVELAVLTLAIVVAAASFAIIRHTSDEQHLLTPVVVAVLLLVNLLAYGLLLVLVGRRIARRRAARSPAGGEGQLHVRLVALFSASASVPTVLLAIIASLLFQYGAAFWFAGPARGLLESARTIAKESFDESLRSVDKENVAMAVDVWKMIFQNRYQLDDPRFVETYSRDVYQRSLSQSVIFSVTRGGQLHREVIFDVYGTDLLAQVDPKAVGRLSTDVASVASISPRSTQSLTRIPGTPLYLFSTRVVGTEALLTRMKRVRSILAEYNALQLRARSLQLRFNAALLLVSLLIIGVAVWIALTVADRLIAPVGELVDAARRVEGCDLTARVAAPRTRDEVGTLASAFNQMTDRLQQQNTALVTANDQLDSRRALIEAVMGGVSAGVISVAGDGMIRIINRSAAQLLEVGEGDAVGRPLADVSTELARLLDGAAREAVVQVQAGAELRTLAVRIARRPDAGVILTFDDMTQQLQDQRRAAWADVARRIAHEIKNPLTPIQLAAERLQRRYGRTVEEGDTTFARLTDTIVRQVGDLRRMVDEFSSFARMPKPVFRPEPLVDIARQTMFLHEVAHPGIRFDLRHGDPGPSIVCDRRQISQALTNLVKNAVEAVEATGREGGSIAMTLGEAPGRVSIEIADNGVGLPAERDRILEPYMTTRARGTGLGLAIVKKIVEEHAATIGFADRGGGGTVVKLDFDADVLAGFNTGRGDAHAPEHDSSHHDDGPALAALTRIRT